MFLAPRLPLFYTLTIGPVFVDERWWVQKVTLLVQQESQYFSPLFEVPEKLAEEITFITSSSCKTSPQPCGSGYGGKGKARGVDLCVKMQKD